MEHIDKYKEAEILELEALQIKLIKAEPPDKGFSIESNYTHSGIEYESMDTINEDIVTYLNVTLENQSDEDSFDGNYPFICEICQEGFTTYENLYVHSTVHIQAQNFENLSTCTICHEQFEARKLAAHFRTHDVKKSYSCCYCNNSYFIQNDLDEHVTNCHTTFNCSKCNKAFKKEIDLKDHHKKHNDFFPYGCSICNESFATISELSRHISTHKKKIKNKS